MQNKKIDAQLKQWKQQWKVNSRKIDESQKSYVKTLTTFSQLNPQVSNKTNAILAESENGNKKIEKQSQTVYGKLQKINQSVNELKQVLKYFDKTNQSLLKVQKLSESIFSKMDVMKNQMANSYDDLDQIQRKLTSDLELIDRRIEGFEDEEMEIKQQTKNMKKIKNKQNVVSNINSAKNIVRKVQQEQQKQQKQEPKSKMQIIQAKMKLKQEQVQKVDEQIRQLGKFLGWHEEDHKDFLTIWNRNQPNKTYFEIQDQLISYFKLFTNQQIIDHMNKYMKLKKLNDKKKILINEYKQLKQDKKQEEIAKIKKVQHEKAIKQRKQELIKKSQQQQKQMKQKVQLWKKKKQQVKVQEKQKQIQQQKRKKVQQMQKKRQQQQMRKEVLERWKQQQRLKKQKQSKQTVKRPHSAVNKETIERIKQREQQIIKQKMQKAIRKRMQQQQMQKKAQRIKQQKIIKYAHVNSKLQEKTTAVKEKARDKFDGKQKKDANTFGGQLFIGGIRAIPEWRQGL